MFGRVLGVLIPRDCVVGSQLNSSGKQMLLRPVALCREQGAAMGVHGSKSAP